MITSIIKFLRIKKNEHVDQSNVSNVLSIEQSIFLNEKQKAHLKMLEQPLKNLLTFLKEQYSYDSATYHCFSQPFTQYSKKDQIFLKNAFEKAYNKERRSLSLDDLNSFECINLGRRFDNTHVSNTVPIYTLLDTVNTDMMRIIIDGIDFKLGFLRIEPIQLKKINGRDFLEYKEYYEDDLKKTLSFQHLQSVFTCIIPLRKSPPFLDIKSYPSTAEEYKNYENRYVELIIRRYFDRTGIEYCSFELMHYKNSVKSKLINITNQEISFDKEVENFLFPLLENPEQLEVMNITPVFSKEFMEKDFSDYILLKNMQNI
jgi:hypothetical protein